MKSNSDVRPLAIQPLGNGAYYYNYNIVERVEEVEPQAVADDAEGVDVADTTPQTRTTYDCDTVQLQGLQSVQCTSRRQCRRDTEKSAAAEAGK